MELCGVVQEMQGRIVRIYASLITIQASTCIAVPKALPVCSTDKTKCIAAWFDVRNCLAKPGPVVVTSVGIAETCKNDGPYYR